MKNLNIKDWLPEIIIIGVTFFFVFRELGTFPDAWEDDSLFMIVAKNLAEGRGYTLPVYDQLWSFPYLLAIGPAVIVPPALFIKLFGFSITIARLPMVLYLIATTALLYKFTKCVTNRWSAQWATALLVTLSAFINTGKPVLGEIPAFFFLLLGFWMLQRNKYIQAGIGFGIAVMSKLTFGIIYPAIGVAWLLALIRKDTQSLKQITIMGITSVLVFLPWRAIESMSEGGFLQELNQYAIAEGGTQILNVLTEKPELLLRFPYLYFGVLLVLALIGLWQLRRTMHRNVSIIIVSFAGLFILFFLNGPGWYRHLLPAHLMLLPFVAIGARNILKPTLAMLALSVFVAAQFWWQFTYQGSRKSTENDMAAAIFAEQYADKKVVIRQPDIYVRLPERENWLFLSGEFGDRTYERFTDLPLSQEEHCLPVMRRVLESEYDELEGRIIEIHKRYKVIEPPASCYPLAE